MLLLGTNGGCRPPAPPQRNKAAFCSVHALDLTGQARSTATRMTREARQLQRRSSTERASRGQLGPQAQRPLCSRSAVSSNTLQPRVRSGFETARAASSFQRRCPLRYSSGSAPRHSRSSLRLLRGPTTRLRSASCGGSGRQRATTPCLRQRAHTRRGRQIVRAGVSAPTCRAPVSAAMKRVTATSLSAAVQRVLPAMVRTELLAKGVER